MYIYCLLEFTLTILFSKKYLVRCKQYDFMSKQ